MEGKIFREVKAGTVDGLALLSGKSNIIEVARSGILEEVKRSLILCDHNVEACEIVARVAASKGHTKIVEYIDEWDTKNALKWSFTLAGFIQSGKFELMKRLLEKRQDTMNLEVSLIPLKYMAKWCKQDAILKYIENFEQDWELRRERDRKRKEKYFCDEALTKTWN